MSPKPTALLVAIVSIFSLCIHPTELFAFASEEHKLIGDGAASRLFNNRDFRHSIANSGAVFKSSSSKFCSLVE